MNNLKLTRTLGLIGTIIYGTGEFLEHFDPLARFSVDDFMADISDARLTTDHFLPVVGMSFISSECVTSLRCSD